MKTESLTNNPIIDGYALDVQGGSNGRLAIGWLSLAMGSLVVGGLFTILIVLSRTPGIQEIFPWVDFFHTALVVHVDLTVLVWFLSFAGVLWSINSREACIPCGWLALVLAIAGAAIISLSPFLGAGGPLLNNYVPVLRDPIFFTGLGIFGLGFTVLVLRGLLFSIPVGNTISGGGALRFGLFTGLLIALLSILALLASYFGIPEGTEGSHYYELLFWGAGHTLQFTHTQLMLVVWLWLATVAGSAPRITPRVTLFLFALGALPALATLYIYFAFDIGSPYHLLAFTIQMQYGGGLAALPVALVLISVFFPGKLPLTDQQRGIRSALQFSIILFGAGGIIGYLISGSNVTVPAHYHGSIVAVTLTFMGLTYYLLPRLGFKTPQGRMVRLQPVIYSVGQLSHITGLAWSGGHGVQRKTAGAAQGLEGIEKIAGMGLMGLGGLIAVVGGVLFLVIVFKSMWPSEKNKTPS
ncbi:MAG: cytochrome c oxidase subunit I [Gammaproteobacteria bacterium]|nr:cytochrome c oxidase subunit I [Gammaproteobacteria bacterium]